MDARIKAVVGTLIGQRNAALDRVADLEGEVADLKQQIAELVQTKIEKPRPQLVKDANGTSD